MTFDPFANVERDEAAEQAAAASRSFSDLLRQRAGRQPTPSASPLAQALAELDAAEASRDELRIDHASRQVDAVLDAGRERAAAQRRAAAPDFAGGARPPVTNTSPNAAMNDLLRASATNGWR